MPLTVSLDHYFPAKSIYLSFAHFHTTPPPTNTHSRLEHECRKNTDMVSRGGLEFITTLTKLLDRLFDFRNVAGEGGDEGQDLKMHVMYNLLVSSLLSTSCT